MINIEYLLAPSAAALRAIALPIPLDAPVMNKVLPASFLQMIENNKINVLSNWTLYSHDSLKVFIFELVKSPHLS